MAAAVFVVAADVVVVDVVVVETGKGVFGKHFGKTDVVVVVGKEDDDKVEDVVAGSSEGVVVLPEVMQFRTWSNVFPLRLTPLHSNTS